MEPVLSVDQVSRSFGSRLAVDQVSFSLAEGETYGLLGPNGAGKSTTISMICGLLAPDQGTITVAGTTIATNTTAGRSEIGYVPQEIALYPDLTAKENLRFFAHLYQVGDKATSLDQRVDEVLDMIGLTDRANDRTDSFSGGMKRRLNIGLGLLHSPRLLVLDEPTVGVDPQSRNAILTSVEDLGRSGLAVLYTTHYMEEAERLCDRIGIIDEGNLIAEGTRRELTNQLGDADRITIELDGDATTATPAISEIDQIRKVDGNKNQLEVMVDSASETLPQILHTLAEQDRSVRSVTIAEPDLEAVFLHLTGKALRD